MFGIPTMQDHGNQLAKLYTEDRISAREERMFVARREVRESCLRMASALASDPTADILIAEAKKLEAYITGASDEPYADQPDDGA